MSEINRHFDEQIDQIMDPDKVERNKKMIQKNPLLAAGVRGFDKLKWDISEGIDVFARAA